MSGNKNIYIYSYIHINTYVYKEITKKEYKHINTCTNMHESRDKQVARHY